MAQIVIDARELRTSTGRYVERLMHYLQKLDHRNNYTVLLKPQDIAGWQPANERWQTLACPYKEFTFAEQLGLLRQINKLRPDLVHFAIVQQPVLYRGRVVTTMHDLTTTRFDNPAKNWLAFRFKQMVYRRVNKIVARKSRLIITPSQFVRADIAEFTHADPAKIRVTYESADPIAEKAVPTPEVTGKKFIMYIGRPLPHKNLHRLIRAFEQLQKNHPELWLVLAGKKDKLYERHERYIDRNQVSNVLFTGQIGEGQLRWLYEHCEAYIFPSLSEGFGLPGVEAMLHGAPVVASNATCLPEIYGPAAHYFNPLDSDDIAEKINDLLSDPVLRRQLIINGHAQAKKYSWRHMAAQTLEIYHEALSQK